MKRNQPRLRFEHGSPILYYDKFSAQFDPEISNGQSLISFYVTFAKQSQVTLRLTDLIFDFNDQLCTVFLRKLLTFWDAILISTENTDNISVLNESNFTERFRPSILQINALSIDYNNELTQIRWAFLWCLLRIILIHFLIKPHFYWYDGFLFSSLYSHN